MILAPNKKSPQSNPSRKFKFDEEEDGRPKEVHLDKQSVEFKHFALALGKLAENDTLEVLAKNPYPKTFTECCQEIYKIVDGIHSNKYINYLTTATILLLIFLSFIVSFIQTVPSVRVSPTTCSNPVCNDNPNICPGVMVCEPVPDPSLEKINDVVIYLFTVEYFAKLFTCWSMSSRDLGFTESRVRTTRETSPSGIALVYVKYFLAFRNLVDLLTILPFYAMMSQSQSSSSATLFLRVFRILKVVRIIKGLNRFEVVHDIILLVVQTVRKSLLALGVMFGYIIVCMVFYGSIIYAVEGGTFQATEDYPGGAYLRRTINGDGIEVSPFVSIPVSFYWVIITCTTVGYGDLVPTSWIGRMIGCILCLTAVLVLAIPIGIIGANFAELYDAYMQEKELKGKMNIDMQDEGNMIELFNMIDEDQSGVITIFQLKEAFEAGGIELNETRLTKIFEEFDADHHGNITQSDFLNFCKKSQGLQSLKKTREAPSDSAFFTMATMTDDNMMDLFNIIDKDGNGALDVGELKVAFEMAGVTIDDHKLETLFRSVDTSGDGEISPGEFKSLFRRFQGESADLDENDCNGDRGVEHKDSSDGQVKKQRSSCDELSPQRLRSADLNHPDISPYSWETPILSKRLPSETIPPFVGPDSVADEAAGAPISTPVSASVAAHVSTTGVSAPASVETQPAAIASSSAFSSASTASAAHSSPLLPQLGPLGVTVLDENSPVSTSPSQSINDRANRGSSDDKICKAGDEILVLVRKGSALGVELEAALVERSKWDQRVECVLREKNQLATELSELLCHGDSIRGTLGEGGIVGHEGEGGH